MRINIKTSFLYSLALVILSACDKEVDFSDKLGYDYYPLNIGSYIDYQVEKIEYSLTLDPKITRYQVRELVESTYTDSDGELVYRLELYKRNTSSENWVLDSVWASKRTEFRASKVQGNHTFVKLSFPIEEGKTWNGNALNGFESDEYMMQNLGQSRTINNQDFAETLEIVQEDDSSLVSKNKRIEIYAKEIGLIYRSQEEVAYCTTPECLGEIEFGTTYFQTIIGYGNQE